MDELKNGLEKKNKRQNKKAANTKTSGKYRDSNAGTATNGQIEKWVRKEEQKTK